MRPDPRAGLQSSQILQFGAFANDAINRDDAGCADHRLVADVDAPDHQFIALDIGISKLDLGADAGPAANRHEIDGSGHDIADDGIGADVGPQGAQVIADQRRALEPAQMRQPENAPGQPPTIIIDPPQGIAARFRAPQYQPFAGNAKRHRKDVETDISKYQIGDLAENRCIDIGQQHVADENAEPLHGHQGQDDWQGRRLRQSAQKSPQQRRRRKSQVAGRCRIDCLVVQHGGNGAQIAQGIHVLQRHACQPRSFAHNGDKPRRQQRMAAEVEEEIGIERDRLRRQHFLRRA